MYIMPFCTPIFKFPSALLFYLTRSPSYMMHTLRLNGQLGVLLGPPFTCSTFFFFLVWQCLVCRLSQMSLCCRQQQLTAFRRVWPLADWREISKISIHKNSEECAHSHVLGMSTRMSLCRLPLPLSLCLSTCRVCAGVHVLPSGPNRLPSARQLFVTTSHSKGPYSTALHSIPLHSTECSFNSNFPPIPYQPTPFTGPLQLSVLLITSIWFAQQLFSSFNYSKHCLQMLCKTCATCQTSWRKLKNYYTILNLNR